MFKFSSSFGQSALAAIAALVFTATMVGAAVGPARMVETTPVAHAQAEMLGA